MPIITYDKIEVKLILDKNRWLKVKVELTSYHCSSVKQFIQERVPNMF